MRCWVGAFMATERWNHSQSLQDRSSLYLPSKGSKQLTMGFQDPSHSHAAKKDGDHRKRVGFGALTRISGTSEDLFEVRDIFIHTATAATRRELWQNILIRASQLRRYSHNSIPLT